jgi:hypothetical protein
MSTDTPTPSVSRKLTIDDIADTRAYERERADLRARIIELKARRRVEIGTFVTVTFENRDTVRYQIQEMARVERLATDADIQVELDTYNPMIPEPGQLCATLFIELTSESSMQEWLPKLVGIEHSLVLRLADGTEVRSAAEAAHASQLTRETVTAAVHFVQFAFTPAQVESFAAGPVELAVDHPAYQEAVALRDLTVSELAGDLRPN